MTNPSTFRTRLGATLWLHLGRWLERKGLGALAESCYRNGISGAGDNALLSAYQLSQQLLAGDRNQEALEISERLLLEHPQYAKAWCARGAAYRRLAQMDVAYESYERAIELEPRYAQAWCNLGEWWMAKGDYEAALSKFEQALRFNSRLLEALNNRVAVLYELGRFKEAEAAAIEAIAKYPDNAALHVNLGNVQLHTGKAKLAAKSFQKALECDPASPEAQIGLSTLLGESHRLAETLAFIEHEIAVKGESAQRLVSLALAQQAKGDWAATEQTCNKVLQLQPNNAAALTTLAGCLSHRADHWGAIRLYERALEENPQMPGIHSNLAFDATYLPDISSEELYAYHSDWADHFEKNGAQSTTEYKQTKQADRPLRIGYVSGDFGTHPVGFLLRDVIRNHDRQQFKIYCYSMMRNDADPITSTIRENADSWIDALFMSDDELSERIREDRIDILVDLAGHTAYNRLPVFVRKPAPVQATWIGYFHSTGLKSIDYYITDPYTTPKRSGQLFSEIPVWLPHSRFCYSPPDYAPAVTQPPVLQMGHITFGSFNRIEKLVDPVIAAWVQILQAVPSSRLLLKSGTLDNQEICDDVRRRFASHGLRGDRLELRGPSAHPEMLEQYGDVDIALDPFPFNGGMTTLETLWMGVPVITLAGQGIVSRQTVSALSNIGVTELIFETLESYVAGAVALAGDVERLTALRRDMRGKMKRSPLCQSEQFAQDLEMLYRRMWQAWCRGEKLGTELVAGIPIVKKTVLHVGCGPADIRALPQLFQRRWQEIRLDIDPNVAPDVVASMLDMSPVETASMDAVYSSHNIEHLYPHEVDGALREFRRVLKPEGMLVVTCPDLQSVCALVAEDKLEDVAYISPAGPISPIDILYGHRPAMAEGNLYMAHKTGFTAKSLEHALKASGFTAVIVERGKHFDLWALAYPEAISAERIELDRAGCLPSRADALH